MNDSNSLPAITDHFIIGIGASAGGLEPIHELFDNMPHNTNFSFVIVQHLSPDHKSLMGELLSRHTSMRIIEAEENMQLLPNCIYLVPSKKHFPPFMLLLSFRAEAPDQKMQLPIFLKYLRKRCWRKHAMQAF